MIEFKYMRVTKSRESRSSVSSSKRLTISGVTISKFLREKLRDGHTEKNFYVSGSNQRIYRLSQRNIIFVAIGVIALLASTPSSALTRDCAELLAHVSGTRRLRSLERRSSGPIENLSADRYSAMTTADLNSLIGKQLRFTEGDAMPLQEILALSDFSPTEKQLIQNLYRLSTAGKFVDKAAQNPVGDWIDKNQSLLDQMGVPADLRRQFVIAHVADPALSGIEVGAWRILLKSGKAATAIHTSSKLGNISPEDTAKALNGILEKDNIDYDQIVAIQYFHTHPKHPSAGNKGQYLSDLDGRGVRHIEQQFAVGSYSVPVHVYAISASEKDLFVFHGLSP